MYLRTLFLAFSGVSIATMSLGQSVGQVSSPDGLLQVTIDSRDGKPLYSVSYNDKSVLLSSELGLVRNDASFAEKMTFTGASEIKTVKDSYIMPLGKRKNCSYEAHERIFSFRNAGGDILDVIFRVSNDGAAFRYRFPKDADGAFSVEREVTSFAFNKDTLSWLHFMAPGKSGWEGTQPSYEEYYESAKPVGGASPAGEGWCMPALFKTADDVWVLICDTDVDENYCAVRLGHDSAGGIYRIAFPHVQEHRGPIDPVQPQISLPFESPWRVIMVGSLGTIVESTLMTDLATPSKIVDSSFVKPGRSAWHWLQYSDESSTLEWADKYLDFAVKMKWDYTLIDCTWDQNIGYEKMAAFVKKANEKGVDVILWYNSNGPWNTAPMTPKNRMHTTEVRREEFAKLKAMGVKGVKVDFFGGDKQATMKLYLDLFKDAADFGITVNCHGATIPRGWQRTWPNLVSMESVKGMEYCSFDQENTNRQPQHCTVLPFARNVIGSMDFTPTVFKPRLRGKTLRTTPAFELALSVLFESGIQHFGLAPDEYDGMPAYVVEFLQNVPAAWDDTRFIDGYPGEFAVLARRSGDKWYIAGINGTDQPRTIKLDLTKLAKSGIKGRLITDAENRTFRSEQVDVYDLEVPMIKNGGFVLTCD
jgi:hypothetical protein